MSTGVDPFLAHEALDRAFTMAQFWEQLLFEHPFVKDDPDLRREADAIADAIGEFYQLVGRKQPD